MSAGSWSGDTQSFVLPYDLFHGGVPGGDDCPAAGVPGGCGHLIAGTTRVWETIAGGNATMNSASWYVTNNPTTQNMTKQTLGNRSFINQVKYSPKYQSVAMVGTNDANVWIGFNLGTGTAVTGQLGECYRQQHCSAFAPRAGHRTRSNRVGRESTRRLRGSRRL